MPQGLRFTYSVGGTVVFDRMLGLIAARATDMRPAWNDIQDVFTANRRADFDSEGAHSGGRWKRLSPRYEERKRRVFGNKPILRRTDNLYASLISSRHPDHVFRPSSSSMAIGTRDRKAVFHQKGRPKRPPIRLTETEKRTWTSIMHEHIVKDTKRRGGGIKRPSFGLRPR